MAKDKLTAEPEAETPDVPALVAMVRDPSTAPEGSQLTADVHPAMVGEYLAAGWIVAGDQAQNG